MRIDAGLDTGDMLLKWETPIAPEETAVELGRTARCGGRGTAGEDSAMNCLGIEPKTAGYVAGDVCSHPQARGRQSRLELVCAAKF